MKKEYQEIAKPELWKSHPEIIQDAGIEPVCTEAQHETGMWAVLKAIEELHMEGNSILLGGGGTTYTLPTMVDLDTMQCPKGRAASIGSSMKRYHGNDAVVITYQDDNDALAIGTEPLVQAAAKAYPLTVIIANIQSYANSGWQMVGRDDNIDPFDSKGPNSSVPIDVIELISGFNGVTYLARGMLGDWVSFEETKGYIKTAIEHQLKGRGFSLVEILMADPVRWNLSLDDSLNWIKSELIKRLPLGEFKGR